MAPLITLYILGGCVAVAALLFIVMIVLTALRPSQLPNVSVEPPPPLQRVIRALTPMPLAMPTPAHAYAAPAVVARPTPVPQMVAPQTNIQPRPVQPVQRAAAPVAAAPAPVPLPPVVPPPVAPKPVARAPVARAPVAPRPAVRPPVQVMEVPRVGQGMLQHRAVRRPVYPVKRSRTVLRFAIGMFVVSALAASAVVANPMLLDPLCDDYEWFGADATQVVRQNARDAHAAIADFIGSL